MSWTVLSNPAIELHECYLPSPALYLKDTLIICNGCSTVYRQVQNGGYSEMEPRWARVLRQRHYRRKFRRSPSAGRSQPHGRCPI